MNELIHTLHDELEDKIAEIDGTVERDTGFTEIEGKISVAIGMRRTGKTFLMLHKIKSLLKAGIELSRILYIDFEDYRLFPMDQSKLAILIDGFYSIYPENHHHTCYLFLDEIQNIKNWALVVRRFHNSKKVRIYLSGSSAKMLSKEIPTSLRGRSIATEVWPFSFKEFLTATDVTIPKRIAGKKTQDMLLQALYRYFEIGGFPGITHESKSNRTLILQEYVDVVIYRDIIERHQISNASLIKYMILYLLKNTASNFSVNKFYHDLKSQGYTVGRATVYDYLTYIEDAYLAFTVPLYSESIRKTRTNPRKIYAIDPGIYNAVSMQLTKNYGRLFETLIYLDLRRRGDEIYYYLTENRHEIDFFTRSLDGKLHLYQIVLEQREQQTYEREQRALAEAEKELKIKGSIITLQDYTMGAFVGIK